MVRRAKLRTAAALTVTCTAALVALGGNVATSTGATSPGQSPVISDELIVTFKPGVSEVDKQSALDAPGVADTATLSASSGDASVALVETGSAMDAAALSASLAVNPDVAAVEHNSLMFAGGKKKPPAPTFDPLIQNKDAWGMLSEVDGKKIKSGTGAKQAWIAGKTGAKSTVYVGVIDDGIDIAHEDLAANIFQNPFETADGIDNDGNGYVDDMNGWDFANDDNGIFTPDSDYHGTEIAGVIGAVGGNGVGTAGVSWNVKIIPAKFLEADAGETANAIRALDYMTDLKTRHGLNIIATNNSYETWVESPAMEAAINRAADAGILFVAISGNGDAKGKALDLEAKPVFPASYDCATGRSFDCMISVTAVRKDGALPPWANFGSQSVDMAAPGKNIVSTQAGGGYYEFGTGTSYAAPFVTGAMALYAAENPGASPAQVRAAVMGATKPLDSLQGKTVTGGTLDVAELMS